MKYACEQQHTSYWISYLTVGIIFITQGLNLIKYAYLFGIDISIKSNDLRHTKQMETIRQKNSTHILNSYDNEVKFNINNIDIFRN